ncbi:anti-sigma factor family protein [Nocardiopsis ansamitocini]|uniref:Uncharacterized protein n=1 Tax=Nocardiopsis ansamitocini TaxID=1670832 RepID=A0A9W6P467_9ACTN|nr:hypothetical protein [Nocardiopsis ansamitocini]GLU47005.1 hypothetical protein Nans01_13560 [Nocardiopsis ansamitocini]
MTSHVDTETLALLAEGLLEEAEDDSVQSHVAECDRCSAQVAELADVSRVLAGVPAPPLPDGLIARIDEALRIESAKRATEQGTDHPAPTGEKTPTITPSGSVVPLRRRNGLTRWMPYLAAAAAAVFVLGAGAAVFNGVTSDQDGTSGAAQDNAPMGEPEAALSYYPVVVASGTDYTTTDLAEQGTSVLERSSLHSDDHGEDEAGAPAPLAANDDMPEGVSSCVHKLDNAGAGDPALIDMATFEGRTAWVMLFPVEDGYELRVMKPECPTETDPATATIATTVIPGI